MTPRSTAVEVILLEQRMLLSAAIAAFGAPATFAAGQVPNSMAVADLNNDGKVDVITTAQQGTGYAAEILLGNGNGTFQPPNTFAVGTGPNMVTASDLNGDGNCDLAVTNAGSQTVSVLLGNGNGTFQPQQTISIGAVPAYVAIADLNMDGQRDLVIDDRDNNRVDILSGNGDGTFQAKRTFAVGTFPVSLSVADINLDGRPDIITTNESTGSVSVLAGNGDGTFKPQIATATGAAPACIAISDFNGDGRPDLFVGYNVFGGSRAGVRLGNGNGTFQPAVTYGVGANIYGITVSDVNGDGRIDLITAATASPNQSRAAVLLGNGNGSFQIPVTFATDSTPLFPVAVDLNDDGREDLVMPNNGAACVDVMLGDVPPFVQSISRASPPGPYVSGTSVSFTVSFNETVFGIDASDFVTATNGVSASPALTVSGSGSVYTVTVNSVSGTGTLGLNLVDNGTIHDAVGNPLRAAFAAYHTQQTFIVNIGDHPPGVALADLNGDGRIDMAIAGGTPGTEVAVAMGNGDGSFKAPATIDIGAKAIAVAVADVNADGRPDLLFAAGYSLRELYVLLGNGNGTFQAPRGYGADLYPDCIVVTDINGDGKPDVVTADGAGGSYGNQISLLLGNGDGTFVPIPRLSTPPSANAVVASDLNGDGKQDLAVTDSDSNCITVFFGNGNGSFKPGFTFDAGPRPHPLVVADFNGDGKPDLATGNYSYSTLSVFLGNGNGTFQARQTFITGHYPNSFCVSDINNDGKLDLITADSISEPEMGIHLGNGNGTFQPRQTIQFGPSPRVVASADINSDGYPDFVVLNSTTDEVDLITSNSTANFTGDQYQVVLNANNISGTGQSDQFVLFQDTDHVHIDWAVNGVLGQAAIDDPKGLTINGNGSNDSIVLITSQGPPLPKFLHLNGTFTFKSLPFAPNSTIDIGRSTVYVSYAPGNDPLFFVKNLLSNGYNGGAWNGTPPPSDEAITSSAAASGALNTLGIGYADSADGIVAGQPTNTIEVRYTVAGDANLDRVVNATDALLMTRHYMATGSPGWDVGNFNFDAIINLADATILQKNYNAIATGALTAAEAIAAAANVSSTYRRTTNVTDASPDRRAELINHSDEQGLRAKRKQHQGNR